jgi:hypothetical protein
MNLSKMNVWKTEARRQKAEKRFLSGKNIGRHDRKRIKKLNAGRDSWGFAKFMK